MLSVGRANRVTGLVGGLLTGVGMANNGRVVPQLLQPGMRHVEFVPAVHAVKTGGVGGTSSMQGPISSQGASMPGDGHPVNARRVSSVPEKCESSPTGTSSTQPSDSIAYRWIMKVMEAEGPAIMRTLHRLLGNRSDVMDAYQEAFCKLAARGQVCRMEKARAYIYRTATNIAVEMIRSRARRRDHLPAVAEERTRLRVTRSERDAESNQSGLAQSTDQVALQSMRDAIAELPTHLRNVITLRDLGRLSYAEVGATLGIDPATARVYRRQAVVKLSEKLGWESVVMNAEGRPSEYCHKREWVMSTLTDDELLEPGGALPQGLTFHLQRCDECKALADQILAVSSQLTRLGESEMTDELFDDAFERTSEAIMQMADGGVSDARLDAREDQFFTEAREEIKVIRLWQRSSIAAGFLLLASIIGYSVWPSGDGPAEVISSQDEVWPFPDSFPDVDPADRVKPATVTAMTAEEIDAYWENGNDQQAQVGNTLRPHDRHLQAGEATQSWVDKVVVERKSNGNPGPRRRLRRDFRVDDLVNDDAMTGAAFTFVKEK